MICETQELVAIRLSKYLESIVRIHDPINFRKTKILFRTIGSAIFLNRAAVKMANMDALLDFMFTNPTDEDGVSLVHENDLLYFADVCAGPGGFSEYVF